MKSCKAITKPTRIYVGKEDCGLIFKKNGDQLILLPKINGDMPDNCLLCSALIMASMDKKLMNKIWSNFYKTMEKKNG